MNIQFKSINQNLAYRPIEKTPLFLGQKTDRPTLPLKQSKPTPAFFFSAWLALMGLLLLPMASYAQKKGTKPKAPLPENTVSLPKETTPVTPEAQAMQSIKAALKDLSLVKTPDQFSALDSKIQNGLAALKDPQYNDFKKQTAKTLQESSNPSLPLLGLDILKTLTKLKTETGTTVTTQAVVYDEEETMKVFAEICKQPNNSTLKKEIARSLAQYSRPGKLEILTLLTEQNDPDVLPFVSTSLPFHDTTIHEPLVALLEKLSKHEVVQVRVGVVRSVQSMGLNSETQEQYYRAFSKDSAPEVKKELLVSLPYLKSENALALKKELFTQLAKDEAPAVRAKVAEVLFSNNLVVIEKNSWQKALANQLLKDPDSSVQQSLVIGLSVAPVSIKTEYNKLIQASKNEPLKKLAVEKLALPHQKP